MSVIGSQTWPHRARIREGRFAELLEELKRIGVGSVELCSPFGYPDFAGLTDAKATAAAIAGAGLACDSTHVLISELRTDQQRVLDWAREAGITEMYAATLGGSTTPVLDEVLRAADEYNTFAAVAARAGVQLGLHNEGFELSSAGSRRTYDILLERLDPDLVKFQFQMSAAARGFVAAEYFERYPGRFISIHVQDVDPAATTADRIAQTSVGNGMIDWSATLRAARAAGVRSYYVEQSMELTAASVPALQRFFATL